MCNTYTLFIMVSFMAILSWVWNSILAGTAVTPLLMCPNSFNAHQCPPHVAPLLPVVVCFDWAKSTLPKNMSTNHNFPSVDTLNLFLDLLQQDNNISSLQLVFLTLSSQNCGHTTPHLSNWLIWATYFSHTKTTDMQLIGGTNTNPGSRVCLVLNQGATYVVSQVQASEALQKAQWSRPSGRGAAEAQPPAAWKLTPQLLVVCPNRLYSFLWPALPHTPAPSHTHRL